MLKNRLFTISAVTALTTIALAYSLGVSLPTAFAQDADQTGTPSSETTQELRKRIERVTGSQAGNKQTGFIGEVVRVTEDTITVEYESETSILPIQEQVTVVKSRRAVKVSEVAVGNWVTVIGTGERNDFTPEFIFVSTESLESDPQFVVLGSIKSLDRDSISLIPRNDPAERELAILRSSKFQDQDGSAATAAEFEVDLQVLVTGFTNNGKQEIKTVRALAPLE